MAIRITRLIRVKLGPKKQNQKASVFTEANRLLENGDNRLLEDGKKRLMENAT